MCYEMQTRMNNGLKSVLSKVMSAKTNGCWFNHQLKTNGSSCRVFIQSTAWGGDVLMHIYAGWVAYRSYACTLKQTGTTCMPIQLNFLITNDSTAVWGVPTKVYLMLGDWMEWPIKGEVMLLHYHSGKQDFSPYMLLALEITETTQLLFKQEDCCAWWSRPQEWLSDIDVTWRSEGFVKHNKQPYDPSFPGMW